MYGTLSVALLPKVGPALASGMPTTVFAYLLGALGYIRLTSTLLSRIIFRLVSKVLMNNYLWLVIR